MKISLGLGIIIALSTVVAIFFAINGYLQKDENQIVLGSSAFAAGILFTIIGTFIKKVETNSKDESVPGGGFEM